MKVKLQAIEDSTFQVGYKLISLEKDEIVEAKFSEFGVSLKLENVWSLNFRYKDIESNFKPYNQN